LRKDRWPFIILKEDQGDRFMPQEHERFIIDANGKTTGVILPVKRYHMLLEDLHDLAVVAERGSEEPITFDVVRQRLERDGALCGPFHILDSVVKPKDEYVANRRGHDE
jgi:hypothetical protein